MSSDDKQLIRYRLPTVPDPINDTDITNKKYVDDRTPVLPTRKFYTWITTREIFAAANTTVKFYHDIFSGYFSTQRYDISASSLVPLLLEKVYVESQIKQTGAKEVKWDFQVNGSTIFSYTNDPAENNNVHVENVNMVLGSQFLEYTTQFANSDSSASTAVIKTTFEWSIPL